MEMKGDLLFFVTNGIGKAVYFRYFHSLILAVEFGASKHIARIVTEFVKFKVSKGNDALLSVSGCKTNVPPHQAAVCNQGVVIVILGRVYYYLVGQLREYDPENLIYTAQVNSFGM